MPKLTKTFIETVVPHSSDAYYWDDTLPGFGVRIRNSTRRTYIVQYRTATGQQRKRTLGRHGILTTEQARKLARDWLSEVKHGHDPAQVRDTLRQSPTVKDLAERYLREHATIYKKAGSVRPDTYNLRLHILPRLGHCKIPAVTRADILCVHTEMQDTPGAANRTLALLSKMFSLAEAWGWREPHTNPVRQIRRYPEKKRERYLTLEELHRLGTVLQDAERTQTETPTVLAAIRLLMFTGCRREEILKLRWNEVDLQSHCLRLIDSKTGTKVVQLNTPACTVLRDLAPHATSPYVLPGKDPTKPRNNITKAWYRLRARAQLDDVRLHDLRHSFASVGVSLGWSLPIIGALLGHADTTTTQRYSHLHNDPLREAVEHIGTAIAAAMHGNTPGYPQP